MSEKVRWKIRGLEQYRQKLWFSVLINAILLLLLLLVFRPAYETNDDMGMANIVNGAKGVYDPHLIFSHYFLGVVLSVLYRITDMIPWYPILQYAVLFASFTAVTYVLNQRKGRTSEMWISLVLITVFAYEGYINLQFTKTAGIASAAGMFLIFYAIAGNKVKKASLIFGFLIACLGSMYRMHQFLAEGFLMTGVGVYQLLRLRGEEKGRRLRKFLMYIGTFGCLLVCVAGLRQIDKQIYNSSEEWQEYLTYNKLRGKLYDYGFPKYGENKEVYNEFGITRTAYKLYQTWTHMDTEMFTTELLEELYEIQPKKSFDRDFIEDFFDKFPASFLKIPVFYCFLLLLVYQVIWRKNRGAEVLTVLYEIAAVLVMYMYLYFAGRYLLNRVDVGLWFAAALTVMWISREVRWHIPHWFGMAVLLGTLILYQNTWQERYRSNTKDELAAQAAERAVIDAVQYDSEHLYLTKPKMVSFAKAYGVFDHIPFGSAKNIYSLGGWTSASPVYSEVLETFGVTNPFRDMIDNEKIYLIDSNIELTMKYIRKYYDKTAEAVPVFVYAPYQVYQIISNADS